MTVFQVNGRRLIKGKPTYFIADIAANHDGDLQEPKTLFIYQKRLELIVPNFNILKPNQLLVIMVLEDLRILPLINHRGKNQFLKFMISTIPKESGIKN